MSPTRLFYVIAVTGWFMLLAVPLAPPVQAQTQPSAVRVTLNGHHPRREREVIGTMAEPRPGCVNLLTETDSPRCIPVDSVKRVAVAIGTKRNYTEGVLAGSLLGGVLGIMVGAALAPDCTGDFAIACGAGTGAAAGFVLGGSAGVAIGFLATILSAPGPRWVSTSIEALTFEPRPTGGTHLGLRLAF